MKHLRAITVKEKIEAEEEALHVVAQKADGALRDALSIFDQLVSFTNGNLTYDAVLKNLARTRLRLLLQIEHLSE